jgi:hypothetical protein
MKMIISSLGLATICVLFACYSTSKRFFQAPVGIRYHEIFFSSASYFDLEKACDRLDSTDVFREEKITFGEFCAVLHKIGFFISIREGHYLSCDEMSGNRYFVDTLTVFKDSDGINQCELGRFVLQNDSILLIAKDTSLFTLYSVNKNVEYTNREMLNFASLVNKAFGKAGIECR